MADNIISALNIGGTEYNIYATSAISAETLTNTAIKVESATSADNADTLDGLHASTFASASDVTTLKGYFNNGSAKSAVKATSATEAASADKLKTARTIAASSDVTWSVSFDGSSNVTGKATINNVPWSAASGLTNSNIATTESTGFASPSAVAKAINDKIAGVYTVQGDASWATITGTSFTGKVNGYVYNLTAVTDGAKDRIDQALSVGDNVVYVTAGTAGWDKLASTVDLSPYQTTAGMTAYVAKTDATYTATTAYANDWNTNKTALINSAKSGAAASAWITAHSGDYASSTHTHAISDVTNLGTYTAYAKDWNDNKTALSNSAKSGWSAYSAVTANSASWASGEANQNAYAKVSVFTAAGQAKSAAASAKQDTIAFSSWGSNIALTATSDANGNPVIGISGKNTTYSTGTGISISNDNKISVSNYDSIVNSAKSGWSAFSAVTANSANWAKNDNTKYSLSGWNGVTASYTADGSTTALKVSGVDATTANPGVTKASYVTGTTAYIF